MAAGASLLAMGKGVSAFGTLFEGQAAAQAAEFNAGIERWNAVLVRQWAAESERRFRRMSKKRMGSMRAAAGASGFTMSGSALDAMYDSAMQEELDALTIRYQGEIEARSHEMNAAMADRQARNAKVGSAISAIGELF